MNDGAGGRSQVTGLVAWVAVILTLVFLTPLFTNLPQTVLAALILHALWHIVASRKLQDTRHVSRTEFALGVLTFAGVVLIDVLTGMLIGLMSALLIIIYRSSRPHLSRLGRAPSGSGAYRELAWHPEAVAVPGVLIVRLDAQLYYANALTVRDQIMQLITDADEPVKAVVIDAVAQDSLDITSSNMLKSLVGRLRDRGIELYFAEVHPPLIEFAAETHLLEMVGEDNVFETIDAAVEHIEDRPAAGESTTTP